MPKTLSPLELETLRDLCEKVFGIIGPAPRNGDNRAELGRIVESTIVLSHWADQRLKSSEQELF